MRPALLLAVITLTGCATVKRDAAVFDRNFRTRVKSFTLTEGIGIAYISQRWEYNPPPIASK